MADFYVYMPTIYRTAPGIDSDQNIIVEFTEGLVASGTNELQVEATFGPTGAFPEMMASGIDNTTVTKVFGSVLTNTKDTDAEMTYGTQLVEQYDVITDVYMGNTISNLIDLDIGLILSPFIYDFLDDTISQFKIYKPIAVSNNTTNELYVSTDKKFYANIDVFSTVTGTLAYIGLEATTTSGSLAYFNMDMHNAYLVESYLNGDIYSTASGVRSYYITDSAVASGTVTYLTTEASSVVSGTQGVLNCDVRTLSLEIGDFFLDVEEYTTASATVWVDITDILYDVSTSGTYFIIDGVPEYGVTFSGINNGYRMFYNPTNDFYSVGGITYTVHAENVIGDYREESFGLLYGYDVLYSEPLLDWGPLNQVVVWMKAWNLVFCPMFGTDAFYFITRDFESVMLGASITAVSSADLNATLYPVNDFFFYGRTYKLTVSGVKDFSGNEMEPFIYEFTIEDPTS